MLYLVRLTAEDVAYCRAVAASRTAKGAGKVDRYGTPDDPERTDLVGVVGEYAGSVWFDTDPPTDVQHPGGDLVAFGVGTGIEIRTTYHANGRLRITDDDPADRLFVLARVAPERIDRVWLAGCYRPRDGLDPAWWQILRDGYAPAYYVPQNVLRPLPGR